MTDVHEKRRFHRFLFSKTDRAIAILDLPKYSAEGIRADILNLSEGGVGLRFSDRESSFIYAGDDIVFDKVTGIDALNLLNGMRAEIKWVLDHKSTKSLRAGCEFAGIDDNQREALRRFIEERMAEKLNEHKDD